MQTQMMLFVWVMMIFRVCVQISAASLHEIERSVDVEENELEDLFQRKEPQISAPVTLGRAVNAPGNLLSYQDKIGQTFLFTVYGSLAEGPLHGSHIYTLDSYPARAAIHVGLARPGYYTNVRVTILPGQSSYLSCTLNGITSTSFGASPASFKFTDDNGEGCNPGSFTAILPGPPTLEEYRGRNGETFTFTIFGYITGNVFGAHNYTDDSTLASAAVHAGMLKAGEERNIRVTILPDQGPYMQCTLNGVHSSSALHTPGSFRFTDDDGVGCNSGSALPAPPNLTTYRGKNGQTFLFTVTGALGGSVWGTHTYKDDSSLATAAVHAGVVRVGETKNVRVTIRPGQSSYQSCTLNGIKSSPYGAFAGSYEFPDDAGQRCDSGSGSGSSSSAGTAIPAPGRLTGYHGKNGQTFLFTITGAAGGPIWGTHVYTDDSSLARAAVHAGLVKVGETKNIRVTILPGQSSYLSCTLHGITSTNYGRYAGSFRFTDDDGEGCNSGSGSRSGGALPAPPNLTSYRGKNGQTFLFTITGASGGPIWGTHVYTDDSSLARAAVHAGLVKVGETKNIRVTILPGQSSYLSCTLHGITSTNYGRYAGSFRFTDDVAEGCSSSSSSGGSGSGSGAGGWHTHSFTSTWISSGPGWISTYFTTYTVFSTVDGGDDIQWESSYEDSDTEIGNSESYTAGYPFGGGRVVTAYYSTVTNTEYNSAWVSSGNY